MENVAVLLFDAPETEDTMLPESQVVTHQTLLAVSYGLERLSPSSASRLSCQTPSTLETRNNMPSLYYIVLTYLPAPLLSLFYTILSRHRPPQSSSCFSQAFDFNSGYYGTMQLDCRSLPYHVFSLGNRADNEISWLRRLPQHDAIY